MEQERQETFQWLKGDWVNLYNLLNGYNAVAVLEINQETGEISVIQRIPVEGTHPRICALSPDGRFLITTCLGGEIAVYRVGENGLLTRTEHNANLRGSAYITFFDPHK
jgi:6-phosphogluconolactonase (cycloisomerase 2 family)